ncbi:phage tail spike protein [Priestia flexa]|uniref:phage tail spike protein n=1 Tax=Priestia flexa TaxID=86664 RepID=UPI003D2B2B96
MIHLLNSQSDHIVAFLSHGLEAATHTRNSNLEEVLTFSWPAIDEKAAFILQRNRAVIEDEDGQYREFIIDAAEKDGDVLEVTATASYLDLKKAKAIAPITLTGQTAATATSYVLAGTEWEPGVIEHAGVRKVVFDKHINPYLALQQLASEFGLELVFRVEISGNRIVRRVVDLVTRVGRFKGKEIVFGKDLLGLVRKEKSDEIVTALLCLGPEKEDGTRITMTVEDEEARQRWGRNNQHLWDIYEPESSDQDMTVERLKSLGETALKKRINSVVEYEISQGDLESIPGYEHEQVRFGDTVRIKDLHYKPPLYMEARTISVERDLLDPSEKEHVLGEFIEYTERDVLAEFDDFKKNMRIRIIKQPTPPQGAYNVLWVDTSRPVHVLHTWDGVQWRKVTPTEASEVGAETPQGAQEKADNSRDEAKEYTDGKVVEIGETIEQVQQDVFNRERVIKRQPTEPVNPLYGDLWVDTSDPLQPMYMWNDTEWRALGPTNADEMGAVLKEEYEQKVQEIIADLANKVPNENYSSTVQEIMSSLDGKAGLEYVNGQLSSKVNAGTVYTKTEVDNALNSRVLKTTYETDKTGIVQRLDSSENRLTVNEKEIGLRAKQQALDTVSQRVTSAEQAIVLQDGKIELMVEKETFNNLKGTVESYGTRITQAESNINLKAEKTALTTTNQNVSNALQSITNLQTEIDLAYEQIALRAKQTDFNTLSNQVSSHQAQLTVQANEIASRVTQDQFNALSIGVRNLVLNSTFNKGWDNWTGVSGGFSIVSAEADKPLSKIAKVTASGLSTISIKSAYANTFLAKKGDTITVSMDIKVNDFNQYDEKKPFIFELLDINRNRVEYKDVSLTDMNITSLPNNEWVRVVYVHKVQNSSVVYGRVRLSLFKNGTVFYREIKAEYGNKNTSWTEAPEDVDEKINGLDGRISTAETNISQTATEIKSLAKKSELDTVSGRLDTAESTISQQAAAIAQRVTSSTFTQEITNTKSYADSSAQTKANTAETNAKNHANTKASTAEANAKSYTDGKISTVTTRLTSAESLITQQANEIQQRVTQTQFDSLSIGVRNLLTNSGRFKSLEGWNANGSGASIKLVTKDNKSVIEGLKSIVGPPVYGIKKNMEYIYSARVMFSKQVTFNGDPLHTHVAITGNAHGGKAAAHPYQNKSITIPANTWTTISLYLRTNDKIEDGSYFKPFIYQGETLDGVTFWVEWFKFEEGNRPTDWTQAQEDIDAQINSVSARVSTAESTITQQAGLIAQKVSTTDYNGNTIASKIVQTSTAIDLIARNLNLTGLVTFNSFNSDVQNKINSGTTAKTTLDSKASIWDAKETPSGAQSKADAAKNSAISTASTDATNKANQAKKDALFESGSWISKYAVNTTTILPLKDAYGANLNDAYSYELQARTTGTGTETTSICYLVSKGDGAGWDLFIEYEMGNNSNHPKVLLNNGTPSVTLYNHTTVYTVEVKIVAYRGRYLPAKKAQDDATRANNAIADMSSDGKITPIEKVQLKKEWAAITSEKTTYYNMGTTFGLTSQRDAYNTSFNTLQTDVNSVLASMTTTSIINGSTFRAKFDDYYDKKAVLIKAVNEKSKTLADDAQGTANSVNSTVNTNKSTWDRASYINSNGTINSSRLTGLISESLLANSSNWNDAKNKVDIWKWSEDTTKINGGTIATKTIFAQQMAIGDFTNLCQHQVDGDTGSYTIVTVSNDKHFRIGTQAYASFDLGESKAVEFKIGDEYYLSAIGYKESGVARVTFIIRYHYTDGTWNNAGTIDFPLQTTGGQRETVMKITTAPTSGKTVSRVRFFLEKDNGTTGHYYLRQIELRKRYGGNLIVDGSILAKHIVVENLAALSANLGIVTAGELRSVTIKTSNFDSLSGSVINIGTNGAGMDLFDGSFRLKQSAGHYYSINNAGQHIFWQGSDPFIRIRKTQDADSNPAVQGARAQLVFLKDRTAVYARDASNSNYADFAANEFRAIGKYVSIVNGNLESTTGYMAVTAATENTGSTQHVYLRPSGSGSVHVLRNTSFNIDSSSPDYRPIIVQTVGTRSTSLSKTNIREVDFNATSLLKDVDVHEYHTISDVVGGNYFDKKIGFITEMTPSLMKFENNIDLYTTLALVWKQNQEQQEEIERLEKEKNDIHDVLGVLIDEIDALKKAVSAV